MTLTKESMVLIGICTIDLISTLILLGGKTASEGNPLMSFYLRYGIGTFILIKLTLVFLPVFVFEWCRQYRPGFVRWVLRGVIAAYLGVYLILFLTTNVNLGPDAHLSASPVHAQRTQRLQ